MLDPATGVISGTPTTTTGSPFSFTITATDSNSGCTGSQAYSITINPAPPPCATDVSSQVTVTRGGFRYVFATRLYQQTITVRNTSGSPIAGPIAVALDNLTPGVTLANADGTTMCALPAGSPYKVVTMGSLAPGASATATLQFGNPMNRVINYTERTLSGSNR